MPDLRRLRFSGGIHDLQAMHCDSQVVQTSFMKSNRCRLPHTPCVTCCCGCIVHLELHMCAQCSLSIPLIPALHSTALCHAAPPLHSQATSSQMLLSSNCQSEDNGASSTQTVLCHPRGSCAGHSILEGALRHCPELQQVRLQVLSQRLAVMQCHTDGGAFSFSAKLPLSDIHAWPRHLIGQSLSCCGLSCVMDVLAHCACSVA